MSLAQGPQHSDAGEARTPGLSVSSQALYRRATVLPMKELDTAIDVSMVVPTSHVCRGRNITSSPCKYPVSGAHLFCLITLYTFAVIIMFTRAD